MRGLGELETVVMDAVWRRHGPATVRDVHAVLAGERTIAYTTVMTVMDNLHRKGLLTRQMTGRAWLYRPANTREEYTANLMHEALDAATDQTAALAHFVDQMNDTESQLLRRLLFGGRADRP